MQLVAMDLLGPLPESSHKNSYILVVADYFTRWTEAYALPNQEAGTVARKVVGEFFFRFSLPEQIHSDQGKQFESEIIRELTDLLQIRKTLPPSIRWAGRAVQPHTTVYACDGCR